MKVEVEVKVIGVRGTPFYDRAGRPNCHPFGQGDIYSVMGLARLAI